MKKNLLLLIVLLCSAAIYAQDKEDKVTKFESYASKAGSIMKFVDYYTQNVSVLYMGKIESSIRVLISEDENSYFYRLEKPETSSTVARIAMIEYSDLVEINKALEKIASDADADIAANPDYLENRFITEDGVRIGYYIKKGKLVWFLQLTDYSNSTVFFKDSSDLIQNLKEAQSRIEELKAAGK